MTTGGTSQWKDGEDTRRLTPTERLHEVTMAAMLRRPSEPEQSVTISRNARGIVQAEVTARGTSLADVLKAARASFDAICAAYPYPETNGGAE